MRELTPSEKGGIAEMAIASAAVQLGIVVSRPMVEGKRYDLIFDLGEQLLRVQCKWANYRGDYLAVRTSTSRHTPRRGYLRTTYTAAEIDAIAVYCDRLCICASGPLETTRGRLLRWRLITSSGL